VPQKLMYKLIYEEELTVQRFKVSR
jgi:hypothetical protein